MAEWGGSNTERYRDLQKGDPIMTSYGPIKKSDGCNLSRYLTAPGACGIIRLWSIADLASGFPGRTHRRIP